MGATLHDEDLAIRRAGEIPRECKLYISHHVRNGLVSILGSALRIEDQQTVEEIEEYVRHIACDLEKVGL